MREISSAGYRQAALHAPVSIVDPHRRGDLKADAAPDLFHARALFVFEFDGLSRHDRRNRVLVDELRPPIPHKRDTEIVERGHDALQLDAVHEEYRQGRLLLADVIEERVLQGFRAFCCHVRIEKPLGAQRPGGMDTPAATT